MFVRGHYAMWKWKHGERETENGSHVVSKVWGLSNNLLNFQSFTFQQTSSPPTLNRQYNVENRKLNFPSAFKRAANLINSGYLQYNWMQILHNTIRKFYIINVLEPSVWIIIIICTMCRNGGKQQCGNSRSTQTYEYFESINTNNVLFENNKT